MRDQILFISPFFHPEKISTGKWNTSVVKEMAKTNDVTVLCLHPIYPEWKVKQSSATLDGVNIVRKGKFLWFSQKNIFRRITLELYFAVVCVLYVLRNRKKFDSIVCVFPPSLMAYLCLGVFPKRKVGIIHDLQGVYIQQAKSVLNKMIGRCISFIERYAFRSCDRLIFLSNELKDNSVSEYSLNSDDCRVAYPFVTIDDFEGGVVLAQVLKSDKVNIVYSGALGEKQKPEGLIELLTAVVERNSNVEAHVFSAGPVFDKLKAETDRVITKLYFHDLVDEDDLPELLCRSDIQVVPQQEGTSGGSLPSKLPNIIASPAKLFLITDPGSELVSMMSDASSISINTSWELEALVENLEDLIMVDKIDSQKRLQLVKQFSIDAVIKEIECT